MTTNVETIAFRSSNKYNKFILFKRKSVGKEVQQIVSSYELIWRLIVLLLLSNNNDESQERNKE